jgi:hypothetical protein
MRGRERARQQTGLTKGKGCAHLSLHELVWGSGLCALGGRLLACCVPSKTFLAALFIGHEALW